METIIQSLYFQVDVHFLFFVTTFQKEKKKNPQNKTSKQQQPPQVDCELWFWDWQLLFFLSNHTK